MMLQLATGPRWGAGMRIRKTPTLDVMRREDPNGTPLRLADLVALTGFSKPKLIGDIDGGFLAAHREPRSGIWLIPFGEAQRYLRTLGII